MRAEFFKATEVVKEKVIRSMESGIFSVAASYAESQDMDVRTALPLFIRDYFTALGIQPKYEAHGEMSVGEMEKQLLASPGIVLANHPDGHFDIPAIMQLLAQREKLKIMVKEDRVAELVKYFGPDFAVPAAKDIASVRKAVADVKEHIDNGGLFLIFPGGGHEGIVRDALNRKTQGLPPREALPQVKFESFTGHIIKRVLRPTDMVFSFYIDPEDVEKSLPSVNRRLPLILPGLLRNEMSGLVKFDQSSFRVGMSWGIAKEWQNLSGINTQEGTKEALSRHYLEQFGVEYQGQDE